MKLSKSKKNEVLDTLLSKMFDQKFEKISEEFTNLGNEILEDQLDNNHIELIPKGWLPKYSSFVVYLSNHNAAYFNIQFVGPYHLMKSSYNEQASFNSDDISKNLVIKIDKIQKKKSKLEQEKKQLKVQIQSILESVNTSNQLIEIWPDVTKYISLEEKPKAPMSVAPYIANINKYLP